MCGAETEGKAIHRVSYLRIHHVNSHQTLDTIVDANKCFLKEPDKAAPDGPARVLEKQRQTLAANYWRERWGPQWRSWWED